MLQLGMLNRPDFLLAQRNIRPGRHFSDLRLAHKSSFRNDDFPSAAVPPVVKFVRAYKFSYRDEISCLREGLLHEGDC